MADVKGMNPEQINKMLTSFGVNQNGKANVENLVNSIFDYYGAGDTALKGEMRDLFENYALKDGVAELSAKEYVDAMNSDDAKAIISKISGGDPGPFADAMLISSPTYPNSSGIIDKEAYRKNVAQTYGKEFARTVFDPVQEYLDKALEYAANHNGSVEGFGYEGLTGLVKVVDLFSKSYNLTDTNDVTQIVNGQEVRTINDDAVGMVLKFDCLLDGQRYVIMGHTLTTDTTPWVNGGMDMSHKVERVIEYKN